MKITNSSVRVVTYEAEVERKADQIRGAVVERDDERFADDLDSFEAMSGYGFDDDIRRSDYTHDTTEGDLAEAVLDAAEEAIRQDILDHRSVFVSVQPGESAGAASARGVELLDEEQEQDAKPGTIILIWSHILSGLSK
jgi:hypothetical protein